MYKYIATKTPVVQAQTFSRQPTTFTNEDLLMIFFKYEADNNTPGTRGWSRLRDRTLAVPKNRAKISLKKR